MIFFVLIFVLSLSKLEEKMFVCGVGVDVIVA